MDPDVEKALHQITERFVQLEEKIEAIEKKVKHLEGTEDIASIRKGSGRTHRD